MRSHSQLRCVRFTGLVVAMSTLSPTRAVNSPLRRYPDEKPHSFSGDRLFERQVIHCAPAWCAAQAASFRRQRRAALVPVPRILGSVVLRLAYDVRGHCAQVSMPREKERRRAMWKS
ncbi:hypothetical protein EDB85DRAFT_1936422 [Lactarius pseudohatsudake]|nr:hypothetical protein EDB85DRAFT_1936422 [Lactarius pseudohatsudake]